MGFWRNFWMYVKKKMDEYEEDVKPPANIQAWENIKEYNPLSIANTKLTSLVCDEATVEVVTDSTLAEPLIPLAESLEAKRYEICAMMNGKGGCFVTMATGVEDEPYHRIIAPCDVSVYKTTADKIYEIAMVIDKKIISRKEYRLIRHHILDEKGTLYVYYYTTDKTGNVAYLEEWENYADASTMYLNANNIGVAYFKNPQDSRGLSPIWGVPLNFGCEDIEEQIKKDRKALAAEMKKAEMKLFVDKSITRIEHTSNGERYGLPEDVFVIQKKAGIDGGLIDEFAPSTRFEDYKKKLDIACAEWEDTVGLNRGFLTEAEHTGGATATEIRTANIKTISMVKRIQSALYDGFKAVLEADSVLLGIPIDLWSISVDWFNPWIDEDTQWKALCEAYDKGAAELEDLILFRFPTLSPEEVAEKILRIEERAKANSSDTLDNMFIGG